MRKDREELARQRFDHQVTILLPHFEPALFGADWSDLPCFRWKVSQGLTAYLTVQFDRNNDRFHVSLTWMLTDRQPVFATPGAPDSDPNQDGLTINLGLLWSRNAVQWKVKYLPEQGEISRWLERNPEFSDPKRDIESMKVFPRVDDAVERFVEYGLPYLEAVARKYG